jgi:hypothetical protein
MFLNMYCWIAILKSAHKALNSDTFLSVLHIVCCRTLECCRQHYPHTPQNWNVQTFHILCQQNQLWLRAFPVWPYLLTFWFWRNRGKQIWEQDGKAVSQSRFCWPRMWSLDVPVLQSVWIMLSPDVMQQTICRTDRKVSEFEALWALFKIAIQQYI